MYIFLENCKNVSNRYHNVIKCSHIEHQTLEIFQMSTKKLELLKY
jgi:hypothetical protein